MYALGDWRGRGVSNRQMEKMRMKFYHGGRRLVPQSGNVSHLPDPMTLSTSH